MSTRISTRKDPTALRLSRVMAFAGVVMAVSAFTTSASARNFSDLPQSIRESIERLCAPLAFSRNVDSYRACIANKVDDGNLKTNVEVLSFDEKFAAEKFCSKTGTSDSDEFAECLKDEIDALSLNPVPQMLELSEEEKQVVRQSCYSIQETGGVSRYRQCLSQSVSDLETYPAIDLSSLGSVERTTIILSCTTQNPTLEVRDYRRCLANELSRRQLQNNAEFSSLQAQPILNTSDPAGALNETTLVLAQAASSSRPARVISRPQPSIADSTNSGDSTASTSATTARQNLPLATIVDSTTFEEIESPEVADTSSRSNTSLETADSDPMTKLASGKAAGPDSGSLAERFPVLNQPLSNWIPEPMAGWLSGVGINTVSKLGFLAIPAAVLILLIPVLVSGRRKPPIDEAYREAYRDRQQPTNVEIPVDRHASLFDKFDEEESPEVYHQRVSLHENTSPGADISADADEALIIQRDTKHKKQSSPKLATATSLATSRSSQKASTESPVEEPIAPSAQQSTPLHSDSIGRYADWLEVQSIEDRQRFCIEFLLYWISFGESNYEDSLREELDTQIQDSDSVSVHLRIKRVVINADPADLQSTLDCINKTFSPLQKEQSLKLLLTILVKSNQISSLQNAFLRFFSDFTGLGLETLSFIHEDFFGQTLPKMPRPDSRVWWDNAPKTELNTNISDEPAIALLGVEGSASAELIDAAFDQLKYRHAECHYQSLGRKEQNLILRHYEKSRLAYEKLCEVEV